MAENKKTTPPNLEMQPGEMPVHYVKSNFYRVVHADGIFGGGTPTPGNIMMTVFSHRVPLPEATFNDGLGNEILSKRMTKYGIENEYEVSITMNLETARIMRQWLDNAISNTENAFRGIER